MLVFTAEQTTALAEPQVAAWLRAMGALLDEAGLSAPETRLREALDFADRAGVEADHAVAAVAALACAAPGLEAAAAPVFDPAVRPEGMAADRLAEMLAALAVDPEPPETRGDPGDLFTRAGRAAAALREGAPEGALASALGAAASAPPPAPRVVVEAREEAPAAEAPPGLEPLCEAVETWRGRLSAATPELLAAGRGGRDGLGSFAGHLARARQAQARLRRRALEAGRSGPLPAAAWRAACRRLSPPRGGGEGMEARA